LAWNASTDNVAVSHYVVYRNGLQLSTSDSTRFTDSNVVGGHFYNYQVSAVDTSGNESQVSDLLAVKTPDSEGINVTFVIHGATTVPGQDVYVVGNHSLLGNWSPTLASGPGDGSAYPTWTLDKVLPASTSFEFKAIIKDAQGNVQWEPGANNAYTTPVSGSAEYTIYW
jgi:chitodextrinase